MRIKELVAKNNASGMVICQRFIEETGERFYKVEPVAVSKMVLPNLLKAFKNMPVDVKQTESGWIRLKKKEGVEDNEKLLKAGEQAEKSLVGEDVFEKEVNLLKSSGFLVKTKEYEI